MTDADALTGVLRLRPGRPPPNIDSSRPALAAAVARGQRAAALPELLGRVFALCGGAHRITAQAAIAAAGGRAPNGDDADLALRLDTLREQIRRVWLDWPPALAGAAPAAADLGVLRDCPLLCRVGRLDAILATAPGWVAEQVTGGSHSDWLARWEDDPAGWLDCWCERATTLPARLLHGCRDAARRLATFEPRALRVHAAPDALAAVAAALRADPGFARAPEWQGTPWETGPWTRLAEAGPGRCSDAWLRLGARVAEIARLAAPEAGTAWLRRGALPLGAGEALAWCEMARGLLIHRVELDGAGAESRIARCDVLAPTEWNFHPAGPVAQAIAPLRSRGDDNAVRLVAAAFDPCVAIRIEPGHA